MLPEIIPLASGATIDNSCNGYPVLTSHHVAKQYADVARARLNALAKMSNAARRKAWNQGAEKKWLGRYGKRRFVIARAVMNTTAGVLASSRLTIECDRHTKGWAKTYTGGGTTKYEFVLGRDWLFGTKDTTPEELSGERPQTLIHEAAHHGEANKGEFLGRIGVKAALLRAKANPLKAVETADNTAYYAMCRATTNPACTPKK
jgi:hypothetical protein